MAHFLLIKLLVSFELGLIYPYHYKTVKTSKQQDNEMKTNHDLLLVETNCALFKFI